MRKKKNKSLRFSLRLELNVKMEDEVKSRRLSPEMPSRSVRVGVMLVKGAGVCGWVCTVRTGLEKPWSDRRRVHTSERQSGSRDFSGAQGVNLEPGGKTTGGGKSSTDRIPRFKSARRNSEKQTKIIGCTKRGLETWFQLDPFLSSNDVYKLPNAATSADCHVLVRTEWARAKHLGCESGAVRV